MKPEKDKLETVHEKIKTFPTSPGLYIMKGRADKVLYIGKAKNLRSRVASYFQPSSDLASSRGPKIVEMINKVQAVDFLETESEVDAMLQEARLIKDIRPPYNTDLVDDKTFPYLEITTADDFPGVYVTRKPRPTGSRLFGPFAGAKDLRAVLAELQKIFKFRTCRLEINANDPNLRFFRPCILHSIKQCTAPCAAKIQKSEYKKIISDFVKFLRSKRSVILRQLKDQMAAAAAALEYEKAAMLRDRVRLIDRLDRRGTLDENVQPEVFAAQPAEALEQLQKILNTPNPIRIIEGIDIAHISGSQSVGSLVKFIDGRAFKNGYRRFKIKTVKGIDDYAMIAEVVKRRYKYALEGQELWPDLILIDGGLGQLHAAEQALKELLTTNVHKLTRKNSIENRKSETGNCRLAALAKRQEELFISSFQFPISNSKSAIGNRQSAIPLRLPRTSPALKLLQYVRDESHRFAQHYHHLLRDKKLLEED